jgi:PTH1 family peptidyl-tRNA hydrolase
MAAEANNTILIIGLGNPQRKHALNRHNIGFITLDYFADTHRFKSGVIYIPKANPKGPLTLALNNGIPIKYSIIGNKTVVLLKPNMWMNNSGIPVAAVQSILQVPHDHILLIHDDTAFEFGEFKIKPQGGAGGHKGVRSVIDHLGYDNIVRLRIGIDKPEEQSLIDYVLSDFTPAETKQFCGLCSLTTSIITTFIEHGADETMSIFNQRKYNVRTARI